MSLRLDPKFQSRHNLIGTAKPARPSKAQEEPSEQDYEAWRSEKPQEAEALDSMVEMMAKGEVTPAEAFGISDSELAYAARLGAEQLELGQYENARKIFLGLTTAEPSVPHFHVSLGQVYAALQRHSEAYHALSDGIELFTKLPKHELPGDLFIDAVLLRGQTLIRLRRPEEAVEDLTVVLAAYQDRMEGLQAENPRLMAKLRQVQLIIETLQSA
jgi:tetratricopeptide (TPR) repeat protein